MQVTVYMTLNEAARALNISEARLEHHAFRGDVVPIFHTVHGVPIFTVQDIRRLGEFLGKLPVKESEGDHA